MSYCSMVADPARAGRPAQAQAGEGEYLRRQAEHLVDGGRVVADFADRAAAQAHGLGGIDEGGQRDRRVAHRIEKQVEMVVRKGLAAQGRHRADARAVAAEHQEGGRGAHPGRAGQQIGNRSAQFRVADVDDVALLQIAFAGRGEGAGAEQADHLRVDRAFAVLAMAAVAGDAGQGLQAGASGGDGNGLAEAFVQAGGDGRCRVRGCHRCSRIKGALMRRAGIA